MLPPAAAAATVAEAPRSPAVSHRPASVLRVRRYVMASMALTTALVQWQAIRVAIARKKVCECVQGLPSWCRLNTAAPHHPHPLLPI